MQNLIAVVVAALVVVPGSWWVSHTRLVAARNEVASAWADVEAELQLRHELVPRLVEVVRASAEHERELLVEVAQRNRAATVAHSAQEASLTEPPLTDAVARLVALRERYPALSSQRNFLELQRELALVEDRIAAARRFHNTRVERLNRRVAAVPSRFVARRHGFEPAAFFDA